jgi:microcystin-dependent protein
MPYTLNHTDVPNNGSIIVDDRTIDESTSLNFPGKNVTGYGTIIGENFLHLLENFASTAAPTNPTQGQLWYDSTPGANILKVYDGSSWSAAGGVKRANTQPEAANSLVGDLWVNTDSQQLYLFTGSTWILVGPDFSEGLSTGFKIQNILGKDNVSYTVMTIEVKASPVVIIATNSFEPKAVINGFLTIEPGINLSTANINAQGAAAYNGPAKSASNLLVGTDTIPSTSFVRNDTENTLAEKLKIRNNNGISLGEAQNYSLTVDGASASLTNSAPTSSIDLRLNTGTNVSPIIRINYDKTVGINKLDPQEALDVNGNIKTNQHLIVTGNTNTTGLSTGSIQTAGGASIAQDLFVQGTTTINNTLKTNNIEPLTNNTVSIGTSLKKFSAVHASNFYGNFIGNISGTVTGVMNGPATKLASPTQFSLVGDVSSNTISFDGQGNGTAVFTTAIDPNFINNKNTATSINPDDEILINTPSDVDEPLKKVTHSQFLGSIPKMPPGVILPYGGDTDPDPSLLGGGVWLLCDGREVLIGLYPLLYAVIGNKFKGAPSASYFGIPDMRGRMPLGADNMGGVSANRVTSNEADLIGNAGGNESHNIAQAELPDHVHDMYNDANQRQYYATRATPESATTGTVQIPTAAGVNTQNSSAITDSGGIKSWSSQTPMDIMNPFLTTSYIIYTGKDVT